MRSVISKTISDFMLMKDMDAKQATAAGIEYLVRKVKGRGGVIVIDRDGNCSCGFTTKKMIRGWIEKGGESCFRFQMHHICAMRTKFSAQTLTDKPLNPLNALN